jgi:uncharacterized repeat protein (TIGR01451 family)
MRSDSTRSRGTLAALLSSALIAIFAVAGVGTAFAADCSASLPGSCFAGADGDQTTGPDGMTDWQDIAAGVTPAVDPLKGNDTKFGGGDKELQPGSWDFITGNNTPKTDILKAWSAYDGNFLHLALERVKQSGDTFLAFELNQLAPGPRTSGGIPVPHRSTGDILFTYDIHTTGRLSFGMCRWTGDENVGNWLRLDGTPVGAAIKTCTQLSRTTQPAAQGAVNWNDAIDPNYLTDFKPIGSGRFGEALVGIGALGGNFLSDPCGPNGWVWVHSRASLSVVSQPKDLLTGNPITTPTCGLTIDKKVSGSGAPGTFVDTDALNALAAEVGQTVTYSIKVSNTGSAPLTVDVSDPLCDAGTLAGPDGRDGDDDPLGPGASVTYTCTHVVTANDPSPLVNTACTVGTATLGNATETLGAAPDTICDSAVVETFQPGSLAQGAGSKFLDANGNGARDDGEGGLQGFVFYVDYNDNSALDGGEPAAVSNADGSWQIAGIRPGTFNVREAADPNFTCTMPAPCVRSVTFVGGETATIGEYGNTPVPGQVVAPGSTPGGDQVVLGERVAAGRARLLGPTGCRANTFRARVAGTRIARVVFMLDGKRIKTLTRRNFRRTFAIRINPARLSIGVHRLIARVTFERGSGTRARSYRLSFQRCPRALRAPRFTG